MSVNIYCRFGYRRMFLSNTPNVQLPHDFGTVFHMTLESFYLTLQYPEDGK